MSVSKAEHNRIVHECLTQVNHRANNLLAVIQGIIRMSDGDNIESFKTTIEGRISALAQAHSLLSAQNWKSIPFLDIINGELINYVDIRSPRVHIAGGELMLPAASAQNAAMIMHELAMNAAQHGALKCPNGKVSVGWTDDDQGLHYYWRETGVDDCTKPNCYGTGLMIVERIVRSSRATIEADWQQDGVRFHFFQPFNFGKKPTPVDATSA